MIRCYRSVVGFPLKLALSVAAVTGLNDFFPDRLKRNMPLPGPETYLRLFEAARNAPSASITAYEDETGYRIDKTWMDNLALHTQVVLKGSALNWHHGRVLYSTLRSFLAASSMQLPTQILETGTARGFSAVVMARALLDSGLPGSITTLDALPHRTQMYWGCIDDAEGKKSRAELLTPWRKECGLITFVQGWTPIQLSRLDLPRISFAFLDGSHVASDLWKEYEYLACRQESGDMIVFDDASPGFEDGVMSVINKVRHAGDYFVRFLQSSENRGYAIATRK